MLQFRFIVEMDDGEGFKVDADARDIRRWEAEYKQSVVGANLSYTFMCQVGYLALRRQKMLGGRYPTYAVFDEHCVGMESESTDEDGAVSAQALDPTPSEATADLFAS